MAILLDGEMLQAEAGGSQLEERQEEPLLTVGTLEEDADRCMKEYFLKNGRKFFLDGSDWTDDDLLPQQLTEFFPRGMVMFPSSGEGNDLSCSLCEVLPVDGVRKVLVDIAGNYAKQLDFYENEEILKDAPQVISLVPEFEEFAASVNCNIGKCFKYMFVLGMKPELRSIPAIALGRRIDTGTIFEIPQYYPDQERVKVETLCRPTFSEITAVARDYAVPDVEKTLIELDKVCQLYRKAWGTSQRRFKRDGSTIDFTGPMDGGKTSYLKRP